MKEPEFYLNLMVVCVGLPPLIVLVIVVCSKVGEILEARRDAKREREFDETFVRMERDYDERRKP